MGTSVMAEISTKDIEKQIAELRTQMERITAMMADRSEVLIDQAEEGLHAVADNTKVAVRHVQHEASAVADAARENPIVTSTAVLTIAGIAFAAGYLTGIGQTETRRGWRF
jgi:t-SNARE complex subunit (syntaxin)